MTEKIPLYLGSYGNVDEIGLGTLGAVLQDAYVDENNKVWKRPGLDQVVDLESGAACDGMFWWKKAGFAVHVANQAIKKITTAAGTNSTITGTGIPTLGGKVYWSAWATALYAANGGKIISIPTTGNASYLTDGDAPTTVSHIATLNKKLIALDTSLPETFEYSDSGDATSWSNTFASPERIPDDLKALAVGNDRLWLWGTDSLEVWTDDGVTPFVPEYNGHYSEGGIIGPNAFCFAINQFYWINQRREFVRLNGSTVESLPAGFPQSISKFLQDQDTISDADLDYIFIAGRHIILIQLPTAGKTIAFDILGNQGRGSWYEWSVWDGSAYSRFTGQRPAFADTWNYHLIGSKSGGVVYRLRDDHAIDGNKDYLVDEAGDFYVDEAGYYYIAESDSAQIRTVIRTGSFNHGTSALRKFSSEYTLTVKRTAAIPATPEPLTVQLRYRDDGSDTWASYRSGSITAIDDTTFTVRWRRNGSYYQRQIEIVIIDNAPLLVSPELEEELEA